MIHLELPCSSLDSWAKLVYRCRARPRQLDQVHALLVTAGFFLPRKVGPRSSLGEEGEHEERSAFVYNILIAACVRGDRLQINGAAAIRLFAQMLAQQTRPNGFTFPPLVKSLTSSKGMNGRAIHAQLVSRGLVSDNFVNSGMVKLYSQAGDNPSALKVFDENPLPDMASCNALLDSLCKNGQVAIAERIFYGLPVRDVVSWTTLIDGFLANGFPDEALRLFKEMCREPTSPNEATLLCALSACANSKALAAPLEGKQLHGYILRKGLHLRAFLGTALIDMYGKRGRVRCAFNVFHQMLHREICTWNAMIATLARNGDEARALDLFRKLGRPNALTFVSALTACARAGLVDEGLGLFASMRRDYGIVPGMEHCGCMVDMLGRAALLEEAAEFIAAMPFPADDSVWGALLSACRLHGNAVMATTAAKRLLALKPGQGGRYAALWSTYAGEGMWASAARLKAAMDKTGVRKTPGSSWLETGSPSLELSIENCCG